MRLILDEFSFESTKTIVNWVKITLCSTNKTIEQFEPPRDKTNKVSVRPAKTQISLGIHPVWSESSLWVQWVVKGPSFLHADSEDSIRLGGCPGWSESSLGAQPHCWFCHEAAQFSWRDRVIEDQAISNTTFTRTKLTASSGLISRTVLFLMRTVPAEYHGPQSQMYKPL